jgi:acyl transferase domain-containing protein/surfactin synthase thioesterase subunit/acyl carrier protein
MSRRFERSWDIAIIGMACRFPGAAHPQAFWNNLVRGVESITFFSEEELLAAGEEADLVRHPHYVKAAPILQGYDGFDAPFFGYTPREARLMDPQHRLFLEVAWESLESAGYDPLGRAGTIGVYAGAGGSVSSYAVRLGHRELRGQTGDLGHISNDRDFLCSRVSFKLGLTGPSVNVQSACSTSLLAVDLACRALLDGVVDMAVAGASVVRVPHIRGYLAEPGNIYSVDGHCRAFDARASGTLFGSGVAAVVVKPLRAALAAGDHVFAVIKGSAVTNDGGHKMSYTASTAEGQARAITEALAIARVEPETLGYVECHGTATSLGDPLEIQALTRAFRAGTKRVGFCPIGSVKSNLGHLEQCAGMAGLVKTVLTLQHGEIPASLHFDTPNPRIPFERSPFFVNTIRRRFDEGSVPRRAGVNSVGMGGTNAFLVLEEAPRTGVRERSRRPLSLLNLSARTDEALAAQVANVRETLAIEEDIELRDVCGTANRGRHHFSCRFSALGSDKEDMRAACDRFVKGERSQTGRKAKGARESLVFLFSGQGAQYARMGEGLYRAEPAFQESLDRCLALFDAAGIRVADALFDDDEQQLHRTLYAQPALFSLQIALTELWSRWGIVPQVVIGHSIGEFAAAVAAGACSLEDAAGMVAARARLMEELPGGGAMVSIGADLETVHAAWPGHRADLAIAAENGPDRIVAAGSSAGLAVLLECLHQRGISTTEIKTSNAFHSPLMDPILDAFEAMAKKVSFRPPRLRWVSTVTGEEVTGAPDARYWRDQIRETVRFQAAVERATKSPAIFLEVGPGATLIGLARRCVKRADPEDRDFAWIRSLAQEKGDWLSLLAAVRELYLRGCAFQWDSFEEPGSRRISLPTYPFEGQRWWLESDGSERSSPERSDSLEVDHHPLLGERLGDGNPLFETLLTIEQFPFLNDHRVFDRVILPATVALESVVAAAVQGLGFSHPVISDFLYELALAIPSDQAVWLHLELAPDGSRATFRLQSTGIDDSDPWRVHISGTVRNDAESAGLPSFPSHDLRSCREVPPDRFYRFLETTGLSYGAVFRGIVGLWLGDDEAFAKVVLPPETSADGYLLHPAFLDGCLHVYAATIRKYGSFERAGEARARTYVPTGMESFQLYRAGVRGGWVHAVVIDREGEDEARLKLDIRVYGEDGRPVASFRGVTIRETTGELFAPDGRPKLDELLYEIRWREAPRPVVPAPLPVHWCILSDASGVGEHLGELLSAAGSTVELVTPESLAGLAADEDDARGLGDLSRFDSLLQQRGADSIGVVNLWALRSVPIGDPSDGPPSPTTLALGVGACLDLVKALDRVRARLRTPPRLWIVTRGSQAGGTGKTLPNVAQSPLWGLGRTVALEYPEMWGGLIDLPPNTDAKVTGDLLFGELKAWGTEDQILLRDGGRLAARLLPVQPEVLSVRPGLRNDASYWIVGGLGGVGLKTAEALVTAGARHLVLTGRHACDEKGAAPLEALRRRAEVWVLPSDVADEGDVNAVLTHVREHMPPLKGVVHAAAVFDDAVLANLTWDQMQRVLMPKIVGAWLLSRCTRDLDLEFFILFSSVLSLWGAVGQGAYTTANSFLDALAVFRRTAGLPATVLNWGPWADVGLSERWGATGKALWKQRATTRLSPEIYLDVLVRSLEGRQTQLAVCDTRWGDFVNQFAEVPPLFRELVVAAQPTQAALEMSAAPGRLSEVVRWHVSRVLGVDNTIDLAQPLNELGLDSLLAVNLANRLREALNVPVPTAMLLKGPSIDGLIAELFPEVPVLGRQPETSNGSAPRVAGEGWLIFHRPIPAAKTRLFCFPFAGGGAATFREWTQYLDPSVELVAIEPPGRQTRIDEPPIRDLKTYLQRLVPALLPFLDKPFAVYGHCLGALTLFETVRTLMRDHRIAPKHVFVSGTRAPDELQRPQDFETKLLERLLALPGYSVFEPIYRQPDDVFAEAIRHFNVIETDSFLSDPELRRLILPVIRAEFEMSSRYRYVPEPPWDIPITCLTGIHDTYVTPANANAWSRFTTKRFQLFMVDTEHFLIVDENQFLIRVLNRELANPI